MEESKSATCRCCGTDLTITCPWLDQSGEKRPDWIRGDRPVLTAYVTCPNCRQVLHQCCICHVNYERGVINKRSDHSLMKTHWKTKNPSHRDILRNMGVYDDWEPSPIVFSNSQEMSTQDHTLELDHITIGELTSIDDDVGSDGSVIGS